MKQFFTGNTTQSHSQTPSFTIPPSTGAVCLTKARQQRVSKGTLPTDAPRTKSQQSIKAAHAAMSAAPSAAAESPDFSTLFRKSYSRIFACAAVRPKRCTYKWNLNIVRQRTGHQVIPQRIVRRQVVKLLACTSNCNNVGRSHSAKNQDDHIIWKVQKRSVVYAH